MLRLSTFCHNGVNEPNDLLVHLMSFENSLNHYLLRNLLSPGLNHNNLFPGRSNGQSHVRYRLLFIGGIHNKFPINHTDLGSGTGPVKRNIRNTGGNSCPQHSCILRTAIWIYRHDQIIECHIIAVILGKQRSHGTVYHTGGQHRILRCLPFSPVKTSGDLSHRVQLFLKFHTEREEINALSGLIRGCSRRQYHCVSIMHQCCPVCLLCYSSHIYSQGSPCQLHTKTFVHNVVSFFYFYITSEDSETTALNKRIFCPQQSSRACLLINTTLRLNNDRVEKSLHP